MMLLAVCVLIYVLMVSIVLTVKHVCLYAVCVGGCDCDAGGADCAGVCAAGDCYYWCAIEKCVVDVRVV